MQTLKVLQHLRLAGVAASVAVLAACGGGGGSGDDGASAGGGKASTYTITGKVMDGYIQGAQVCVDLNLNELCDGGEPSTTTGSGGVYSLSYSSSMPQSTTPILVTVPYGAIDESTGMIKRTFMMRTMADHAGVISPFTTMAYWGRKFNRSFTPDNITITLAQQWEDISVKAFGVATDLRSDYVAANDPKMMSAARAAASMLQHYVGLAIPHYGNYHPPLLNSILQWGYETPNATENQYVVAGSRYGFLQPKLSTLPVDLMSENPRGLALSSKGEIFYANGKTIMRVASNGMTAGVYAQAPADITDLKMGSGDALYVSAGNQILRYDSGIATRVAGDAESGLVDGAPEVSRLNAPRGIFVLKGDADKIFVADTGNERIRIIEKTATGYETTTFRMQGAYLAIAVDYNNRIIAARTSLDINDYYGMDSSNQGWAFTSTNAGLSFTTESIIRGTYGRMITVSSSSNNIIGLIRMPADMPNIAILGHGDPLLAGHRGSVAGFECLFAGTPHPAYSDEGCGRFSSPTGIDINEKGEIFVMDSGNRKIRKIH